MGDITVKINKLSEHAVFPKYATIGAAGFDLVAVEDVVIEPGETKKIPLGLSFEIPAGYVMIIAMRSGIALKTKLRQPNGVGVIDSDYRGEVAMMFDNIAPTDEISYYWKLIDGSVEPIGNGVVEPPFGTYLIRAGDRVAQAYIQPLPRVQFTEVGELSETERGAGGFGSTGVKNTEVSG